MHRTSLYSGIALAALLAATPGFAQQEPVTDNVTLEAISVQGQANKKGDGAPELATEAETVLTTRADRLELDDRQVTDIREIDRLAPGVSYSETSRSFNVRGLDTTRVLTTVDGIRVPWIEDGARGLVGGANSFDFDTLSSVDIIKGSDSSVFGSGALGGAVALRTLDPEDLIKPGRNWGGVTRTGFDSKDDSWRIDQAIAGRMENTYFLVQGGYRNGHELENKGDLDSFSTLRTAANPTDYDQESLLVKLHQYVDGGHRFGITGEIYNREDEIDNRVQSATTYLPGSTETNEANKRERVSLDYRYDGGGFLDAASAILYWQRQQIDNDFSGFRNRATLTSPPPYGDYSRLTEREEERLGLNGSALKVFDVGGTEHRVSFGGELFGSKASSFSSGQDNCTPPYRPFASCTFLHTNQADMPEVEGTTFGAFVQNEIALLGNTLRITPGIRYDWYEERPQATSGLLENPSYDGTLPPDSSDSAVSGKLRVEYDASQAVTLFAQWAQAFRAPTANELYLTYGGSGTYLRVGDENLEPETSNGFDVGAKLGDDRFGGSVSMFYNRYENFIDQLGLTDVEYGLPAGSYPLGVTLTINRANVEIYGAEIAGHYKHESGWHTWGHAGAYVGEDIETGVNLNTVPVAKAVAAVGYETAHWGGDVIVTVAAGRGLDKAENAQSIMPSYQLVDLTAWWQPHFIEGLTLRAGVFNLFDEEYYDTLDITAANKEFFTEPGRNFKVSATYQF